MLIFFLVAGSLTPPIDKDVELVETVVAIPVPPPDALTLHGDGHLSYRGKTTSAEDYILHHVKAGEAVRLLTDRTVKADKLLQVAAKLRDGGASSVRVISKRVIK